MQLLFQRQPRVISPRIGHFAGLLIASSTCTRVAMSTLIMAKTVVYSALFPYDIVIGNYKVHKRVQLQECNLGHIVETHCYVL